MAIASIAVSIKARTAAFRKSMKKAQRYVREFSDSVRRAARRVALLTTATVTAATAIGTLLVKQQLSAVDSLAKTADKLGLTTEALAGMRHAAKLSGVDIRKMDLGIQRMTRRVAEAAVGTGEAKAAIAELGLDARLLGRLPVDQQFMAISDAMMRVSNQADRVRLGFKLFDSEGVALINTLALGRKGLMQAADEARRFGLAIGRGSAAQVEMANDAITRLKGSIEGLARRFTVDIAPYLRAVADGLTELTAGAKDFGTSIVNAFEQATLGLINLSGKWGQLNRNLKQQKLNLAGGRLERMRARRLEMDRKWPQYTATGLKVARPPSLAELAEGETVKRLIRELSKEYRELDDEVANVRRAFKNIRKQAERTAKRMEWMSSAKGMARDIWGVASPLVGAFISAMPGMGAMRMGGPGDSGQALKDVLAPLLKRTAEFQQISLARMYLPGLGAMRDKPQTVTDPQNKIITDRLDRLIWETQNRGVTLAG